MRVAALEKQLADITAQSSAKLAPVDPRVVALEHQLQAVSQANATLSGQVAALATQMHAMHVKLDMDASTTPPATVPPSGQLNSIASHSFFNPPPQAARLVGPLPMSESGSCPSKWANIVHYSPMRQSMVKC